MLDIEMANSARLISLNSSSGNYQLKTFLSATESVMVDELGESKDELRRWSTFQTVTKLKNYTTCTQVGEMSKCHLSKFPVWPSKGRSEGKALMLNFLAQYSAAIHVDLLHLLEQHPLLPLPQEGRDAAHEEQRSASQSNAKAHNHAGAPALFVAQSAGRF